MISGIFIDRPRLAFVVSIVITLAGLIAIFADPGGAVPRHRAAAGLAHRRLSRRRRRGGRDHGGAADRAADHRRRQRALLPVGQRRRRQLLADRHLRARHRPRHQHGQRPEPRAARHAAAAAGGAAPGPDHPQEVGGAAAGRSRSIRPRTPTTRSTSTTTRPSTSSTSWRACRGVGQASLFGALDYSLRLWLDTDRLTAFNLTPTDVVTAVQSQNVQAALGRIGAAPAPQAQQFQLTIKTQGRLTRPEQFDNIVRARQSRRLGGAGQGRGPRRARRQEPGALQPLQRRAGGGDRHLSSRPAPTPSTSPRSVREVMDELKQRFPDDLAYDVFWDSTVFVTATIDEVDPHAGRSPSCWSRSSSSCSSASCAPRSSR